MASQFTALAERDGDAARIYDFGKSLKDHGDRGSKGDLSSNLGANVDVTLDCAILLLDDIVVTLYERVDPEGDVGEDDLKHE